MSQSIGSTGLRWLWLVVVRADYRSGQQIPDPPELCSGDTVPLFPSLNLHYVNDGAAFSFLADSGGWQRWFFAGIAIGISVILAVMMYRSKATQKLKQYRLRADYWRRAGQLGFTACGTASLSI